MNRKTMNLREIENVVMEIVPIAGFTQLRRARYEYQHGILSGEQVKSLICLWVEGGEKSQFVWDWFNHTPERLCDDSESFHGFEMA